MGYWGTEAQVILKNEIEAFITWLFLISCLFPTKPPQKVITSLFLHRTLRNFTLTLKLLQCFFSSEIDSGEFSFTSLLF